MLDALHEKCNISGDRLYDIGQQLFNRLQSNSKVGGDNVDKRQQVNENINQNENEQSETIEPEMTHPSQICSRWIRSLGRVYADFEDNEAVGLDKKTVMLIGSDESQWRSVRLNCERMNSFALFAGQTVIVEGHNPRGDMFFVKDIYSDRQLQRNPAVQLTKPLRFVIASGPYTLNSDLTYGPLRNMLNYCKANRPDVLVLVGPFFDASHRMVADGGGGTLSETFDDFFEKIVQLVMDNVGYD